MTLLSQNTLNGFGGIGEGVSMQVTRDEEELFGLHMRGRQKTLRRDVTDPKILSCLPNRITTYENALQFT